MEKLKNELENGFKEYYEELNKKVTDELSHQETQQQDIHNKMGKYEKKIEIIDRKVILFI